MLAMAIFYGYWVLRTNHYVFTTVRLSWNVDLFLDPLYITCTYQVEDKKNNKLKKKKVFKWDRTQALSFIDQCTNLFAKPGRQETIYNLPKPMQKIRDVMNIKDANLASIYGHLDSVCRR